MSFTPQILRFDSLPSTSSEAARQAQQGAAEGLTILAGEQTAGRGRLERKWVSPAGAGLYASIILRPRLDLACWSLLPLMAALAVHEALLRSCSLESDIKWPNDILVNERKICGILAETIETSAGRAVILGIGINVTASAFPETLRQVAISIEEAAGSTVAVESLLLALLKTLADRYSLLQTSGGAAEILRDWSKHSSYAQEKRVLVTSAEETFSGTTRGLESDGALRVETDAGEIRIVRSGDVRSVRSGNASAG
jgi:BirA family transcriptional regulator, biotin operon repressor / biotin---[acetyl-CoA-carboxylase] ligase